MPAGEVVFVPSLPLTVTDVAVTPGAAATGELATVSSGVTEVGGRVSAADADLVVDGAPVVIEIRETDEQFAGTVSYVGPPRETAVGRRRRGGRRTGSRSRRATTAADRAGCRSS